MPRLIDADALERIVEEKFDEHYGNAVYQFIHDFFRFVIRQIRKAPTIDPESLRPHGRWVLRKGVHPDGWEHHYCTRCDIAATFWYLEEEDYDEGLDGEWQYIGLRERGVEEILSPYCPNCGAKMYLEEEDK